MSNTEITTEIKSNAEITKELLQELHNEQLMHGENNTSNTCELLHIFGGIDGVISTYLKSNDIILSTNELQQIHAILAIPFKYSEKNKQFSLTNIYNNNEKGNEKHDGVFGDLIYKFDVNNTYLHCLFGIENGIKIKNVISHKITSVLLLLSGVIGTIGFSMKLSGFYGNLFYMYYIVVSCCFWIPLEIFSILAFNTVSLKLIISSFDFWVKVGYSVFLQSCVFIYEKRQLAVGLYGNIANMLAGVVTVLAIIYISSLDANQIQHKWKFIFPLCGAVLFTFFMLQHQFLASAADDYIINIYVTNSYISFQSLLSSSCRVIALFMWKQGINALRRKEKSVSITYSPFIEWIDHSNSIENKRLQTLKESTTSFDDGDDNIVQVKSVQIQQMRLSKKENTESVSKLRHFVSVSI